MARVAQLLADDDPPRLERELLLAHLLDRDRGWLYAHADDPVSPDIAQRFEQGCGRMRDGEPLAYLLGEWEFFSLPILVSTATLVPRPETEQLVELALERLPPDAPSRVLDLGTGSGAIALAIAAQRPLSSVTATDVSPDALAVARRNRDRLQLANLAFDQGDWWAPVAGQRFDLVVSNPPYVAVGDPLLDAPGEPDLALLAGCDGLDAYRRIVPAAPDHLEPGGAVLLEHGHDQRQALIDLCAPWFEDLATFDDLAGIPRILVASRPRQ